MTFPPGCAVGTERSVCVNRVPLNHVGGIDSALAVPGMTPKSRLRIDSPQTSIGPVANHAMSSRSPRFIRHRAEDGIAMLVFPQAEGNAPATYRTGPS